MKHIFSLIAAVSLLICLFFVALTATTMSNEKTFNLGQKGERTYTFSAQEMDFIYQGKLTTFDDRLGFTTEKHPLGPTGIEYDKQIRQQTPKLPAATGFMLTVPAWYPIALFAILPIAWVLGAVRKKKPVIETETAGEAPPAKGL